MNKDRSKKTLFYLVGTLLIIGVSVLIWAAFGLRERRLQLSEVSIQRTQQLLHVRWDGLFREMAEDLREEAAALESDDSLFVFKRWMPLLRSHWPILSIKLANENGDELALLREDSTFLVSQTIGGSKDGPPIHMRFEQDTQHAAVQGPWLDTTDIDPRERVWFSKSLEDTRNEPCWTLRPIEAGETPLLQISLLLRGRERDLPYRILMFTVDLARSSWLDTHSETLSRAGILLLDDEGRSLGDVDLNTDPAVTKAISAALAAWQNRKTSLPFNVKADDRVFRCQFGLYPLNGQQLNTGVVVDLETVNVWVGPERNGLVVVGLFLSISIFLLAWAWKRQRSSDERIKKQARRNRTQELKLAKALGEREVLNREVHHRVKNNLQVVSSLLNLQATRLDDGPVKDEFLRGKRRIDTIALVHHKLYGLADLRNVDLFRFFSDLVKALAEMHLPHSRTVSHDVDTNFVKADQDTAIELGIILCELVANTYQHAFPYATGGHVEIRVLPVEGDLYRLTVQDNGKGIQEGGQTGSGKLGLEIVEALSEQLDGSFHMRTNGGVHFEVLFRMQHKVHVTGSEAEQTTE